MTAILPELQPNVIQKRLSELKRRLHILNESWNTQTYVTSLEFYVDIIPRLINAERCTIFLKEPGSERIYSVFGTGITEKQIAPPLKGSIAGAVISSGNAIIDNALDKHNGYHSITDKELNYVTRNILCVPVKSHVDQGITGAIQVINKLTQEGFAIEDQKLIEKMADHISIFLEGISLNQELGNISSALERDFGNFLTFNGTDLAFISSSPAMRHLLEQVRAICSIPVNILIQGESGSGKEVIAKMIHKASHRKDQPFVAVNCAAIPENLVESELFGYEKGAFTGATQCKKGLFEEANGGTLFLDEIAELPLTVQPKLLRALQEGEAYRLGGKKPIQYDIRIISATHKDLRKEVAAGRFREDLFFRLFSVELSLPPLRERTEDIIALALMFFRHVCDKFDKKLLGFHPIVLTMFEKYSWPGNVRQLRREVERLVALTPAGCEITPEFCSIDLIDSTAPTTQPQSAQLDHPTQITQPSANPSQTSPSTSNGSQKTLALADEIKQMEIERLKAALGQTNGNLSKAALLLGITRQGLDKKLKRYNLKHKA